jgi:hypothetical protein
MCLGMFMELLDIQVVAASLHVITILRHARGVFNEIGQKLSVAWDLRRHLRQLLRAQQVYC